MGPESIGLFRVLKYCTHITYSWRCNDHHNKITTLPTHRFLSADIADNVNHYHHTILNEVIEHVAQDDIVVVGMAWNPSVRKANTLLKVKGYAHTYLEYGSYISHWKERLSIKMWSG